MLVTIKTSRPTTLAVMNLRARIIFMSRKTKLRAAAAIIISHMSLFTTQSKDSVTLPTTATTNVRFHEYSFTNHIELNARKSRPSATKSESFRGCVV